LIVPNDGSALPLNSAAGVPAEPPLELPDDEAQSAEAYRLMSIASESAAQRDAFEDVAVTSQTVDVEALVAKLEAMTPSDRAYAWRWTLTSAEKAAMPRDFDARCRAEYIGSEWAPKITESARSIERALGRAQDYYSERAAPLPGYPVATIWEGYEPPAYLTKRILSPGALTTIFGQSGHLKSVAAVDLALCNGSGKEFHGIKTRRTGVLYVAGEGHAGIKKRVRAWLLKHGYTSADEQPAVFITSQGLDLMANPDQLGVTIAAAAAVLGVPIELVIIDTLAANFGGGDESLTRDMNVVLAGCRRAVGPDIAILIIHHTGHNNTDRERGAYALIATADIRLQATYDEAAKLLELKWLKCKDDEKPEPLTFECHKVALEWHDEDGEELTSVVLERLEGVSMPSQAPRAIGLGKNQETALKALRTLYARARRNLQEQGRDEAEALILVDGWRNALEQKKIDRRRFHDLIKDLQDRRLIAIDGPHVRLIEVTP
jgi:hypothetical protein